MSASLCTALYVWLLLIFVLICCHYFVIQQGPFILFFSSWLLVTCISSNLNLVISLNYLRMRVASLWCYYSFAIFLLLRLGQIFQRNCEHSCLRGHWTSSWGALSNSSHLQKLFSLQGGPIKTAPLNLHLFFDFSSNETKTDCYLSERNEFWVWIFNAWIQITRFVKLPNSNKNTMLHRVEQRRPWSFCSIRCRTSLNRLCHRPQTAWIWTRLTALYGGFGVSAAERVSHFDFQFGRSQGHSAHLLGEPWPTDHRHLLISGVTDWSEGCASNELWIRWTVCFLIMLFICSHGLLCNICILRTCIRFAIVYWASLW